MNKTSSINKPFWKNPRVIIIALFSILGIITGVAGYLKNDGVAFTDALYNTFQFFLLEHSFKESPNGLIEIARWLIFIVILLLSIEIISLIISEQLKFLKIRLFYREHIVICGLTEKSLEIAHKYPDRKRIFIDNDANNPLHRSIRNSNTKLILGNPASQTILKLARIHKAKEAFVLTDSDEQNLNIAQIIFSLLENEPEKNVLKCYTLIRDRKLKTLLEETALFKYKTGNFDGILFNVNEIGVKYGIAMNIDKILPAEIKITPEILIVGCTDKAENVILNLAHCLTKQREMFKFTIAENDAEQIQRFEKLCKKLHLTDFAEIEFSNLSLENISTEKTFDSAFVCLEDPINALKQAIDIHYFFGQHAPNIFLLYNDVNSFNIVLQKDLQKKKIFTINLLEQIADYVFELNKNIEAKAIEAHCFWNALYQMNTEWEALSGHFKQSNRNQILDMYVKAYMVHGKNFEEYKNDRVSFSDYEKETLAMMEHRRWMIEKYENGWIAGERDNELKRHSCLKPWEKLSKEQQAKDYDAINLMIELLNNQKT